LDKSVLKPEQVCKFLGFILNSRNLSLAVPYDKQVNIKKKISLFKTQECCKIRDYAQILGLLTSVCPAIPYGWLYTKVLERKKYLALLDSNEDYDSTMLLSPDIFQELDWWLNNIHKYNTLRQYQFNLEILSDASTSGWGAVCGTETTSGSWSIDEKDYHINFLELKAAFLGLQCFAKDLINCEVLLRVDNTTAVAYINKYGGIQFPHLNDIARQIWQWCEYRGLWIYASYVNTKDNIADAESRRKNTEWELSHHAYRKIIKAFGTPSIDLFASRINAKCRKFISWKRDPEAWTIDAFTVKWTNLFFYAFPPFSLLLKTLHKIKTDKATGIVVFPYWPSQPWFPLIEPLLLKRLTIFEPNENLLSSTFRNVHPLHRQLTLAAGLLSGKHT
jgi:hypothetical protein